MPGPQAAASDDVPVSVRFMNDSKEPVELLWHREMEGGLVVAQHLSEILPGRSRIIRSFSGHSFSMWQNDKEIQHWTMGPMKRQLYKLSSASRVLGMQPAVPSTASNSTPNAKTGATKQPDHRLADARQLAAQGKYREALELFRSVGDICPIERPKLAARVAHLERIVASEDMLKGRTVSTEVLKQSSTTSPKPRCDKCTLPLPCGKVHPAKRTYAEVAASKPRDLPGTKARSVPPPPLPERPRPWRSTAIGARTMRPVSAEAAAARTASQERLRDLIARAKEARERAKEASQRASELRKAADARELGSSADYRSTPNSVEDDDHRWQPQLKRRRPAIQIPSPTEEILKQSCRQATPRPATEPARNAYEQWRYRQSLSQGVRSN